MTFDERGVLHRVVWRSIFSGRRVNPKEAAFERRRDNLEVFKDFYVKDKARIWP